jgi:hypothetical protein
MSRKSLPAIVEKDLAALIADLEPRGIRVDSVELGSMHSYVVRLTGRLALRIVADRGQLYLEGDKGDLAPYGLLARLRR